MLVIQRFLCTYGRAFHFYLEHIAPPQYVYSRNSKILYTYGGASFDETCHFLYISFYMFKSQFLPRSKISNPLRFVISSDLNDLESLGEKCV